MIMLWKGLRKYVRMVLFLPYREKCIPTQIVRNCYMQETLLYITLRWPCLIVKIKNKYLFRNVYNNKTLVNTTCTKMSTREMNFTQYITLLDFLCAVS